MGKMQFWAEVEGNGSPVTRGGSKASGIRAHLCGWNIGVRVELSHEDGRDVIRVYHTGGSNGPDRNPGQLIAHLAESK
jgi:hypothetical protein